MDAYSEGIIIQSGINLVAVLGLCVLTGFTGLFSFGHAGFMAIGAYVTAMCAVRIGVPFYAALAAGGVASALVSVIIGRLTLKLKGDYFCIATMGFGETIRLFLSNWQGLGGARGWPGLPADTTMWNVILIDVICVVAVWNLIHSRHGRKMIAVREEELAAQMAGVDVFRYKMIALVVSAALAGIAGGLMAHYLTFIQPKQFSMQRSTELTIIVIFGGLGSISGSVLGAVLLTALPEMLRAFDKWRLVCYGLAVIVIMVGRPQGLMGGIELTPSGIRQALAARRARSRLAEASAGKVGPGGAV